MKRYQTKQTDIPQAVKTAVWERDKGRCILCGAYGEPVAHFISRAQGGLGIEQNIVTLCHICHQAYDQSAKHKQYKSYIREYLERKYPEWDENKLVYHKYGGNENA